MSTPAEGRRALRVAVVGVSATATCGVRDHAGLLAAALPAQEVSCSYHWLSHTESSFGQARAAFAGWTAELTAQLATERPHAVLLHYSVFSYAHRGIPAFVHAALAPTRALGVPLVSLLHEYAYPWGRGGLRGGAWAVTQRAALVDVMRASAAVIVTAPFRADWLATRRWLPRREVAFAPVFPNLPVPSPGAVQAQRRGDVLGLFGYAYEGAQMDLVLDALSALRGRHPGVSLQLLGAPGPGTPAAEAWLTGARSRGIEPALSFSGVLAAQELVDALARCDVLLHPETSGPTSRKGTLAGSLVSGRPVVALDGPRAWRELIDERALLIVAPRADALAEGLVTLLAEPARAESLGARGGEFARREMGVPRSARVVRDVLDDVLARRARQ